MGIGGQVQKGRPFVRVLRRADNIHLVNQGFQSYASLSFREGSPKLDNIWLYVHSHGSYRLQLQLFDKQCREFDGIFFLDHKPLLHGSWYIEVCLMCRSLRSMFDDVSSDIGCILS
jgi:hypothetical protein